VKQLADDIVRTRTEEIATMRARDRALADAGVKRGSLGMSEHMTGTDHEASSLNPSSAVFDAAFLRTMIPHHQGAVVVGKAELTQGWTPSSAARRGVARRRPRVPPAIGLRITGHQDRNRSEHSVWHTRSQLQLAIVQWVASLNTQRLRSSSTV
jgi:hypothetical protein